MRKWKQAGSWNCKYFISLVITYIIGEIVAPFGKKPRDIIN